MTGQAAEQGLRVFELEEQARRERLAFFMSFMPKGEYVDLLPLQLELAQHEARLVGEGFEQAVGLGIVAEYRDCLEGFLGRIREELRRSQEVTLGIVGRTADMPSALYDHLVTDGRGSAHTGFSLAELRPWNIGGVRIHQGDQSGGEARIGLELPATHSDTLTWLSLGAVEMVLVVPRS